MRKFFREISNFLYHLSNYNLNEQVTPQTNGLDDKYLFDFKNFASQYNSNSAGYITIATTQDVGTQSEYKEPKMIAVKPIDVLKELETVPTPFSLTLIDEKIEILKDKRELITQSYSRKEVDQLIVRLENRKKYHEHKEFFEGYQNTTDEKINTLLEKYKNLVMKTSDLFVPEFPDEAIKIMKKYTKKTEAICEKKAVFYVIATTENFQQVQKKRDPILLVQSPFGFYWQILGAWEKEMIMLSEL